jgi:two-component system alkaline phosphatase synthesis response regulator PhoP
MQQKILIVDDEPNIVVPLEFLMEQNGYQVMAAASGEEALDLISTFKPDLILLDIMLPDLDGYEVCQNVRGNPEQRNTKILFLSAMGREMDIVKGMALAADGYITKPFAISDVVAKVNELLKGSRS